MDGCRGLSLGRDGGLCRVGLSGTAEAALERFLFGSWLRAGGLSGEHRLRGEVGFAGPRRYGGARLRARSNCKGARERLVLSQREQACFPSCGTQLPPSGMSDSLRARFGRWWSLGFSPAAEALLHPLQP